MHGACAPEGGPPSTPTTTATVSSSQSPIPNPQSPVPSPQSPIPITHDPSPMTHHPSPRAAFGWGVGAEVGDDVGDAFGGFGHEAEHGRNLGVGEFGVDIVHHLDQR